MPEITASGGRRYDWRFVEPGWIYRPSEATFGHSTQTTPAPPVAANVRRAAGSKASSQAVCRPSAPWRQQGMRQGQQRGSGPARRRRADHLLHGGDNECSGDSNKMQGQLAGGVQTIYSTA